MKDKAVADTRWCPKTLGTEILNDNSVAAFGAPCVHEQCMAWGGTGKYECTRKNKKDVCEKEGSCYTDCDLRKEIIGCRIIEVVKL